MGASATLLHPLKEEAEENDVYAGRFLTREVLHGLQVPNESQISRKRSFSKNTKFTMEKTNDLPHRTREFLRNINIQDTSSHHEQKTKLVGHVFDCLSALEQLVQLDNENESKLEGETQSVCDRNIQSLGQLVHELVSIYGLCGDSLKFLLEANPAAAAVEDTAGRMPLHVAVDKHRPWLRLVETLIAAHPNACSTRDGGGRLPLHIAVDRNNPCIETVKLLVQTYPEAANTRRGVGRLPIHYAVFYDQPNLEVVKYLLETNPAGAQTTDVYGRLPLHYAVDRLKPNLQVVKYLLSVHPNGAFVRDTNHRLPLMIAIDHGGPNETTEIVELLLAINPNSIQERGPGGRYPLHIAVEAPKPNLSLVAYLAPLFPEAMTAEITAGKGDTPIAICRANKSNLVLRVLLLLQPDLDPITLREENWKARRIAILISVPRPSTLISTIDQEARPSLYASRNSRIVISVDGSYEIHENGPLDTLRLARKSLQKLTNSPVGLRPNSQMTGAVTVTGAASSSSAHFMNNHPYGFSEWEIEHRSCLDAQDLFISLYLINRDLWRYVILFL